MDALSPRMFCSDSCYLLDMALIIWRRGACWQRVMPHVTMRMYVFWVFSLSASVVLLILRQEDPRQHGSARSVYSYSARSVEMEQEDLGILVVVWGT